MDSAQTVIPLFDSNIPLKQTEFKETKEKLERLDLEGELRQKVLPLCRLKYGEIWEDPVNGHKVGVLDATKEEDVRKIMGGTKAVLAVNDPPYNAKS